jgi:hypothetical protein
MAERVPETAQAHWPLTVVLSCRSARAALTTPGMPPPATVLAGSLAAN